jgi:tetratricopeptide (TPR) repeat protein
MPATESQRLAYRDKFKSLYAETFQSWFEELARLLHPIGDFQKIRKTSGDGALDGFVISSQLVYQVYAPARFSETKDPETAAKIEANFKTALDTLGGNLKSWVFVHNHPQAALGKLSVAAINAIKNQHRAINISVLDIDSLWEKLKELPEDVLKTHFGSPPSGQQAGLIAEEISDLRKEIAASSAKQLDAVHKLPTEIKPLINIAVRSAMAESFQGAEHLKSQNQKRFDRARQELNHGSVVVAEKEFRDLVADLEQLGEIVNDKLLFRSYTNLGSSLWQQFRRDEAVIWFEKAFETMPSDEKAKTNKSICHIYRKDFAAALTILNDIKVTNPDCFDAYYLTSCVYLEQENFDKTITTLEERHFESVHYYEALAHAYLRGDKFSKATEAANKALAMNDKSIEGLVALANSLGFPLVYRRMRREITAFSLTEIEHQQILEAIQTSEVVVKILRQQARHFQLGEMLTNLAAFYELAGDEENAAKTAKEASEVAPLNITTLRNLWSSQMRLGKYGIAYGIAGKMIQLGEKLNGKLHQLESLLLNSEHERLLRECDSNAEILGELKKEPNFIAIKARAQFECHQIEEAFATIKDGLVQFPENARLYTARASICEDLGQTDAAREDLERAEKTAERDAPHAVLQAAMYYYYHGNWPDAAQRFAKLGADSIYSPFLNNYLVCLHNMGQFPQCFALSTKAISISQTFNPTLHELAARCAYNANDLLGAEKHLEMLIQHGTPKAVDHHRMLAEVYLRLDERDKAFAVLKKAYARKSTDVDILIGLSFVSTLRQQHNEAIRYALAAVEIADQNPRAHMALVKAGLDCPPGDKVDDKNRRAFQRSLEFLKKDPSGYIKAIPFEKDLKPFITMAKARADHAHRIEDLIRDKSLPISIIPEQLGVSPFLAWQSLMGHTKLHVHMAYGTTEEQIREAETSLAANSVCVDVFALFTLRLLKQLDLLPKLYPKILVHTAILEAILADIRDMETRKTGLSISYHEGKLVRSEIGPEQIEKQLSFLKEIRDFLKSGAVELVGLDASIASSGDMKMAREFLGIIYYEPILVSKSRGAVYYADDAPMRSLAVNSHGVASFCTQALLRAAKEKKYLTTSQYEDAIITLLRQNYYFVSESVETLARLAESDNFQPSELSKTMLSRIADSKVDQNTAVRILGDFSFYIWRVDFSKRKANRDTWLELCVSSIFRTKEPEKMLAMFLGNLGVRALAQPVIFGGIAHWILLNAKLSKIHHTFFFIAVQQAILQMASLARLEYPWWPALHEQWWQMGRINVALEHNGWI